GEPDVHVPIGEAEGRGHHPHDRHRRVSDADAARQHVGGRCQPAAPVAVADECRGRAAEAVLLLREAAPERGCYPPHLEQALRDDRAAHTLRKVSRRLRNVLDPVTADRAARPPRRRARSRAARPPAPPRGTPARAGSPARPAPTAPCSPAASARTWTVLPQAYRSTRPTPSVRRFQLSSSSASCRRPVAVSE